MSEPGECVVMDLALQRTIILYANTVHLAVCGSHCLFTLAVRWCPQRSALNQTASVTFGTLATADETTTGTVYRYDCNTKKIWIKCKVASLYSKEEPKSVCSE